MRVLLIAVAADVVLANDCSAIPKFVCNKKNCEGSSMWDSAACAGGSIGLPSDADCGSGCCIPAGSEYQWQLHADHLGCVEATKMPIDCQLAENWADWSSCSQTCGPGQQARERVVNVQPEHGGKTCFDVATEMNMQIREVQVCNNAPCPNQDCRITPWHTWSEECFVDQAAFSSSSPVTCQTDAAPGFKFRERTVVVEVSGTGHACPALFDQTPCVLPECEDHTTNDCELSQWAPWSVCSEACAFGAEQGGIMSRTRTVTRDAVANGKPCPTSLQEDRLCNTKACDTNQATDCSLGEWQEWGVCSTTCGEGSTTRTRTVAKEEKYGGVCTAPMEQTKPCKDANCEETLVVEIKSSEALECSLASCSSVPEVAVATADARVIASDGEFVYVGAYRSVMKLKKGTLEQVGFYDTAPFHTVSAIDVSDPAHMFISATAQPTNGNAAEFAVIKVDKANLLYMERFDMQSHPKHTTLENVEFGAAVEIIQDDTHLYVSRTGTTIGELIKLNKKTMAMVHAVGLQEGQADTIKLDENHIFAGTWNGHVVKLDTGLNKLATSQQLPSPHIVSMIIDADSLYVGQDVEPGVLSVLSKSTLEISASLPLTAAQGKIVAMEQDFEYIYASAIAVTAGGRRLSDDTGAKQLMLRIAKKPAVAVETVVEVAQYPAYDMTAVDGEMYIATYSTPPYIVEIGGKMEPVDCQVSEWSTWGECKNQEGDDVACGVGVEERVRSVIVHPKFGGKPCPWLKAGQVCSAKASCCTGGKQWGTTQYKFHCTADGGSTTSKSWDIESCRCPENRPIEDSNSGVCEASMPCHAQKCTHIHCLFMAGRVQVFHTGKEENGAQHKCVHKTGRFTGGCNCICYDDIATAP